MEWINVNYKLPDHECYVIVWNKGMDIDYNSFFSGQDDTGKNKWINFKTPGFEVKYFDPEEITHWMHRPTKPRGLFTEYELHHDQMMEEIRNARQ